MISQGTATSSDGSKKSHGMHGSLSDTTDSRRGLHAAASRRGKERKREREKNQQARARVQTGEWNEDRSSWDNRMN